ncbi:MAG: MgtC/SapB family protein [Clostridia bacterium]|nr:MgtC/SapB family protein [Clostridia bacterium]
MKAFTFTSVVLRLLTACLAGAVFGFGRSRKKRAAGLRTYILTTLGACMSILMAQYEYEMLNTQWLSAVQEIGLKFDASRYGAQVIAGIGFLGAGTIIASGHQQVSGLTTATGLFATACIGMAAGAGFIECVIVILIPVVFILDYSYRIELSFKRRLRNMTIHVMFEQIEDLGQITQFLDESGVTIFDLDIEETERKADKCPAAIMSIRLSRERPSHSTLLSTVAELPCVISVQELVS